MHGGPFDEHRELLRRREAWRARREAMEAEPSGKRWRGRARGYLYHTARQAHDRLRPTRPLRWGAARALRLEVTGLTVSFPDLPRAFDGYRSVAEDGAALIGVISGQVQHQTALQNGVPSERIRIFATQAEAADVVAAGAVHAYASVAMAHRGYLGRHPEADLAVINVPAEEKQPAAGAFALAKGSAALRQRLDSCLGELLGGSWHREMMNGYGFSDADIDRLL